MHTAALSEQMAFWMQSWIPTETCVFDLLYFQILLATMFSQCIHLSGYSLEKGQSLNGFVTYKNGKK